MVSSAILNQMDSIRSLFLKQTLKNSLFRKIYTQRAYRLLFLFFISFIFNFILALKWPLWVLLFGPVVLGVPHLVSSLRYVPKLTFLDQVFSIKNLTAFIGSFFIAIASFRLIMQTFEISLIENSPNVIELLGGLLILGTLFYFSKQNKSKLISGFFILSSLLLFSIKYPFETLGFLVLIHNFIAFIFWIGRARDRKDKQIAILAVSLFLTLNFLIFYGVFDVYMSSRSLSILNGVFNEADIGVQIFPHADITLWSRAVSAYAFGQGAHYFIWLKAIPEQELAYQHTTSFRTSFKLLKADVGDKIIYLSFVSLFILIGYGLLTHFVQARYLYLSLAAFHGYFEITALPFIKRKSI